MVELVGPSPSPEASPILSPTLSPPPQTLPPPPQAFSPPPQVFSPPPQTLPPPPQTLSPPPQVAPTAPTVKDTTNPAPDAAAPSPVPMVQTAPMYTPREPVSIYNQDLPYATPQLQPQNRYPRAPTALLAPAITRSLAGSADHKPSNLGFSLPAAAAYGISASTYGIATPTYGVAPPGPSSVPGPRPSPDIGPETPARGSPAPGAPLSSAAPSGGTINPAQTYLQQPLPASNVAMLPSTSVLTLPMGSKVGQPVPQDLQSVITVVRALPHVGSSGHPERKILKKPYEGTYEKAEPRARLIRDHFQSGSGLLKKESPLMEWYGDERVFEARMWEFLAVQKPRWFARS